MNMNVSGGKGVRRSLYWLLSVLMALSVFTTSPVFADGEPVVSGEPDVSVESGVVEAEAEEAGQTSSPVEKADKPSGISAMAAPTAVVLTPDEADVTLGGTQLFSALLEGAEPEDEVVWSVAGKTESATAISAEGLLTVSDVEGAEIIEVTAASKNYPDVKASVNVNVKDLPFSENLSRDDLVLHYIFDTNDKGPGNNIVKDYSTKGNDGEMQGAITESQWTAAGFTFNGSGDGNWIRIPAESNLVSPRMTLIIGLTRTGAQSGNGSLFSGKSGWASNGLWMNTNNCYISHNGTTNTTLGTYTTVFPQNTRKEFAYSTDARTASATGFVAYDGVKSDIQVAQGAITRLADLNHYSIGLNSWGDEQLRNARFDKYMIFSRDLTEQEVTEVYNGRLDPYKAGLNEEVLSALGRNPAYYTAASMNSFRSARRAAVKTLEDRTASSEAVDAAASALKLAARSLVALPGVIDSVTIDPSSASVNLSSSKQFSAKVNGGEDVPETVEWTVDSDKSTITQDGLLSVPADETKTALTVTVTSTIDYSKFATSTVTVTNAPAVVSISVSPLTADVMKGDKQTFTADVETVGGGRDSVNWSVDGLSTGTVIDAGGELTVGADELKDSLTVKATAVIDVTKFATATVSVYEITGVTITPPSQDPQKGRLSLFTAAVNGTGIPTAARSVTWALSGATSAQTSINSLGGLAIGADETAATLTVKATSVNKPSVFAEVTVNVAEYQEEVLLPNNSYYNSVRRLPNTAASLYGSATQYANNAAIAGWESSGAWRTLTGQTAPNVMSTNTGLNWSIAQVGSPSSAGTLYQAGEGVYLGDWTTYYRFTGGDGAGADISTYTGGVTGKFADIDYSIGMRLTSGSGAVVFRYQDILNYYYVKATVGGGYQLGKVANGVDTVLSTASTSVAANTWYNLRVEVTGDNVKVTRHGYAYWTVRSNAPSATIFNNVALGADPSFSQGRVGVWAPDGNTGAQFNLIRIGNHDFNYKLSNSTFTITSGSQGQLKSLRVNDGKYTDIEFMGNEDNNQLEMGLNKYLGEIKFRYSVNDGADRTANTGASEDIRGMAYDDAAKKISVDYSQGASANSTGIRDFAVSESYSLGTDPEVGDYIQFDINLKNTNASSIEFKDIALPISWNNHWQADSAYENYATHASNYVSYNGSYISVERASGGGDKLVFMPNAETDTSLEYRRYASTQDYYMNMPEEFFICSKGIAAQTSGNWDQGYLPNTSLVLAPGAEKTYSFRIFKTSDYLGINDILVDQGSVAPAVEPGMVVPQNTGAQVDLRTLATIESVEDTTPAAPAPYVFDPSHRATVTKNTAKSAGEHQIYDIKFNKLGRCDITVTYDGGKKTVLQFWVTEDLGDAIQRRADFIVDELFIDEERQAEIKAANASTSNLYKLVDKHLYGFLEFNNVNGTAGLHSGNSFYCTNSDYEQYQDAGDFLAAKNVYYPVQREIDALDKSLIDLIYAKQYNPSGTNQGYLATRCCNNNEGGSGGWSFGSDPINRVERWFNYPTVYNQFWSMYQIAKRYPDMNVRWEAKQYLEVAAWLAYRCAQNGGNTGYMGEQTVADILAAAESEGLTTIANNLRTRSVTKGNSVSNLSYPFGSEFAFDNTGEEGSYFNIRNFSTNANKIEKMKQVADKCVAWIGKTPVWYLQSTGRPMGNDWWMFQYAVGMQAKAYQDWFFNYADENVDDYYGDGQYSQDIWRMVYPAKMSPFIHILSGQPEFNIGPASGALANTDQSVSGRGVKGSVWGNYMPTRPYNWNMGFPYSTSAECDLSLWSGLQILSADIVPSDPSFGLTGYGAQVTDGGDSYEVVPQDGLYRRLNVVGDRFQMELLNDRYTAASIAKGYDDISLDIENATGTAHTGTVSLRNLASGEYNVRVDGALLETVIVAAGATTSIDYEIGADDAVLRIVEAGVDDTSDDDHIISVTVTPQAISILKGGSVDLDANVRMVNEEGNFTGGVDWTVSGGTSAGTVIDVNGVLAIGADEAAGSLTVTATSKDDGTVSGTASVTVYVISGVEVSPLDGDAEVLKGGSIGLVAVVDHENAPTGLRGVTWSIVGAHDAATSVNASGLLSVSGTEAASTLTVRATSTGDPSKYGEIEVELLNPSPVTRDNAVVYYIFDGSLDTAGALKDYSKNEYDTVINGTINAASWPEGGGFAFNGGNYIDLPNTAALVKPEMTIVFKLKRTGNMGVGSVFWGKNSSDYAGNGMWINTSNGLFISHDGFSANFEYAPGVDTLFPLNEWVEIGYAIDTTGATAKGILTVNGEVVSTAIPENAALTGPTSPQNSIGAAGYDFNEKLNNVTIGKFLIFDKALTEADLNKVYIENFPLPAPANPFLVEILADVLPEYTEIYEDGQSVYTDASLDVLKDAIDAAQAIIDAPGNYVDDDIFAAFEDLDAAAAALQFKADKTGLGLAIDAAKAIDTSKLITDARVNLESKLAAAESVYADDDATQTQVNTAMNNLIAAMAEAALEKGNGAKLRALVTIVSGISAANYTTASYATFSAALTSAQAMIDDADNYTQSRFDGAYATLYAAYRGLARVANFSALQAAVNVAQDIVDNIDDYVPASVAGLEDELSAAKAVLDNNSAAQAQVNSAAASLTAKIVLVRLKEDKSRLMSAYRTAGNINTALYTAGSVKTFAAAMDAAKTILDAPAGEYTQTNVDLATTRLDGAVKALVWLGAVSGGVAVIGGDNVADGYTGPGDADGSDVIISGGTPDSDSGSDSVGSVNAGAEGGAAVNPEDTDAVIVAEAGNTPLPWTAQAGANGGAGQIYPSDTPLAPAYGDASVTDGEDGAAGRVPAVVWLVTALIICIAAAYLLFMRRRRGQAK